MTAYLSPKTGQNKKIYFVLSMVIVLTFKLLSLILSNIAKRDLVGGDKPDLGFDEHFSYFFMSLIS